MSTTTNDASLNVDRLLSLGEVAAALGYSPGTVRKLIAADRLVPVRLVPRSRLRFRQRDVQRLIDEGVAKGST